MRREYKLRLVEVYGLRCDRRNGNGCGKDFPLDMLSIDHIIPISMGGSVCDIHNMQLLCFKCHERKTIKIDNKRRTFELSTYYQLPTQTIRTKAQV
jgi:5-methylcytosine-specific restriction endonuclease McrA